MKRKPVHALLDSMFVVLSLAHTAAGDGGEHDRYAIKLEVSRIYAGVQGNRKQGSEMSLADKRLMLEIALRRGVEIIDAAQAAAAGGEPA